MKPAPKIPILILDILFHFSFIHRGTVKMPGLPAK
jgi:hypothetical protein